MEIDVTNIVAEMTPLTARAVSGGWWGADPDPDSRKHRAWDVVRRRCDDCIIACLGFRLWLKRKKGFRRPKHGVTKMHTIKTAVYEFSELSEAAKEKARDWYRAGALDYAWWDFVFDTAKTAGACLGITVDDIEFSGFWSQGDGACFVGRYAYKKGWRAALKAEFGETFLPGLESIGQSLQDAQRSVFYRGTAQVTKNGRYSHEYSVHIECEPDTDEFKDAIRDALRGFMRWIYYSLRDEYEWLMSDEQVDESIEVNKYTFTESGQRFG